MPSCHAALRRAAKIARFSGADRKKDGGIEFERERAMPSPYRLPFELENTCADLRGRRCETKPPKWTPAPRWARYTVRAALLTSLVIVAGTAGAGAHALLVKPVEPVFLGPAAIAKLRRPFPGLMGYGYESHDPYELRKRAFELTEQHYDISVSDVRLSDKEASRLRMGHDDLSGLEPIIKDGKLTAVRVGMGTPLSRAVGLVPGDEITAINGWQAPMIDEQILKNDQRMAVIELSRNSSPVVVCVSWH
jgi:hypothetical protein